MNNRDFRRQIKTDLDSVLGAPMQEVREHSMGFNSDRNNPSKMTMRHALQDIAMIAAIEESLYGTAGKTTQDMTPEEYQRWSEAIMSQMADLGTVDKGDDQICFNDMGLRARNIRLTATAILKLGSDETLLPAEEEAYRTTLRAGEKSKAIPAAVDLLQEQIDLPSDHDPRQEEEKPYLFGLQRVVSGMTTTLENYTKQMDGKSRP